MRPVLVVAASLLALLQSAFAGPSNISYLVSPPGAAPKWEFVLYAKRADYPVEAQKRHWQGRGYFALAIRKDGSVESVSVLRSTGYPILDRAAIAALRDWRFRPHSIAVVRVPLVYWAKPIALFKNDYRPVSPGDCRQLIITADEKYRDK